MGIVETLMFGLVTGSILLLGTVGFSMIRACAVLVAKDGEWQEIDFYPAPSFEMTE